MPFKNPVVSLSLKVLSVVIFRANFTSAGSNFSTTFLASVFLTSVLLTVTGLTGAIFFFIIFLRFRHLYIT